MKNKKKRQAYKIAFLCASPIILVIDSFILSECLSMVSASSDVSVLVGVALLCALVFLNYLLIKLYKNKTTKQ